MAFGQRLRSFFGDPILILTVLGLTLFGTAMIYSAGQLEVPHPVTERAWRMQAMWLGISLVALFFVMRIPIRWLEWLALPVYVDEFWLRTGFAVSTSARLID